MFKKSSKKCFQLADAHLCFGVNEDFGQRGRHHQVMMENMVTITITITTMITTTFTTITTIIALAIRLPCLVDRLEGFVTLWKKNGEIITVARQIIDKVTMMIVMMIAMMVTMMVMKVWKYINLSCHLHDDSC